MKILLINDYKKIVGGTEVYVDEIKNKLIDNGHLVKVFTSDSDALNQKKSFKKLLTLLFNLREYFKFQRLLHDFKPDIVHINGIFNEISASVLFGLSNIPVVMTVHDNQLFSPTTLQTERTGKVCKNKVCRGCINCVGIKGTIYEFLKRIICAQLLRNVDYYIGNSKYINACIAKLKIGKTLHIPFSVMPFENKPFKNFKTVTYVGRLSNEKGIQYLLDAIPSIIEINPKVVFNFVGEGSMKEQLVEKVRDLQISKYVKFLGLVDHSRLQTIYENTTITIMPSIWDEPFGKSGIESMSVGRPVIASRVGGIPEWLIDGKNGFLVEAKNTKQLGTKILYLLSHRKLLEFQRKNSIATAQKYSIESHVDSLERLYTILQKKYNAYL